jgi:hypothetical protein
MVIIEQRGVDGGVVNFLEVFGKSEQKVIKQEEISWVG